MTATTIGGVQQVRDAYVSNVSANLSVSSNPSTCTVTIVEDEIASPQVLFDEPEPGIFDTVKVGQFEFGGIITSWTKDVRNTSGRKVQINLADPREIMKSVPLILAPGYRSLISQIDGTGCSLIDIFGSFDDSNGTGLNLSGWNEAGMPYSSIALALKGGKTNSYDATEFKIRRQEASVFGELYRFNLDEVTARVDTGYRLTGNLINLADVLQDLANRHSFDWFVESTRTSDGGIDVVIKTIDRSTDNTDTSFDDFLAANSGFVMSANRGYELRNEIACVALYGAHVENITALTIEGLANNPVDLSQEGFNVAYRMSEIEMRYLLTSKEEWRQWVQVNGGIDRYTAGGASQVTSIASLWVAADPSEIPDLDNQLGISQERSTISEADEEVIGKLYDKLKSAAEETYGKRFLFSLPGNFDTIEAAWTRDLISGTSTSTSDPNEYFRNENGKTRCYVEFKPTTNLTSTPGGVLGIGGGFIAGKGVSAPQPLDLELKEQFGIGKFSIEADKSDWIVFSDKLYVAATIEEGSSVVRIDSPTLQSDIDVNATLDFLANNTPGGQHNTAQNGGTSRDKKYRIQLKRQRIAGGLGSILYGKAFQPTRVFVPTKNKFLRYGPVISSNVGAESQGKLEIENDDGFSPWEFGGESLMQTAMQLRVDNSSSSVKKVENGRITIEGLPRQTFGESIGLNSNISSISISFGAGSAVSTTYELRTFLRKFGELSKDELAILSLLARRAGPRIFAQDTIGFINKNRPHIARQFGGRTPTSHVGGGAKNFE